MIAPFEKKEIGNLIIEGIPDIPAALGERLHQYESTREAFATDWLPEDSGLLIITRLGESAQFHSVSRPGAVRKQLTFFEEPVAFGSVCPDPAQRGFLFGKDLGGNENYQLYYFDLDTQHYRMLTDGQSRNEYAVWSNKGDCVVYSSTRRNNQDHDLYIAYPHDPSKPDEMVFSSKGYWYPIDWSPNDEWITIGRYLSVHESELYRFHLPTKTLKPVLCDLEDISCYGGYWDKQGEGIYYAADVEGEFRHLSYYRIADNRHEVLWQQMDWDVEGISLSPDGTALAFTVNDNGISLLFIMNTESRQLRQINNLPKGECNTLRWHPDGKKLALTINTATAPADAFVLNMETGTLDKWTFSEVGGLDPDQFIEPDLIYYPTFDMEDVSQTRYIPAFYFKPRQKRHKLPVLIYIHGGPESQYRPVFSPIFQYYLNEMGLAVVAPNVRGSSGYGKSYLKLDNGYLREHSVMDIGTLLDWIATQPDLDASRVAVMGGSYGGYMVLASMSHFNARLRCGIDIVGISNFITFLKNTKSYRRDLRRVEYGDERDPNMRRHLLRISPTTNAHKITKPMLIVQGLNDPRVPATEAEQMLKAIRQNGSEAWYLLAKDEGHGFRKKSNKDYYTKAVILFLKRYLLNE
jgi:protease II